MAHNTESLWIQTPATTANLGPGFDSFGLALKLYNRFGFTPSGQDTLSIAPGTCIQTEGLSLNPQENLLFKTLDHFYHSISKPRPPFAIEIEGHVPLARGLGSSSSAIAAALMAANLHESSPLGKKHLCQLGSELEGHPDNIVPALLGGVHLCDKTQYYPLNWPEAWKILIAVPEYPLLTEKARGTLPNSYSLSQSVHNLRKASLLTYALLKTDAEAFSQALEDELHQPYRSKLIPEFSAIKTIAKDCGAFGAVISGAGPAVAVFYPESARRPLDESLTAFIEEQSSEINLMHLSVDTAGTTLIKQ